MIFCVASPPDAVYNLDMPRRVIKKSGATIPLYQQLTEKCRKELRDGTYRADERFPSERELVSRYGISRVTANKVISNLVAEGLLIFRPGIGSFVAPAMNLSASLREMESFTESAKVLGLKPSTEVLVFKLLGIAELPAGIADLLRLSAGDRVYQVERLRIADTEPVILEFRWIHAGLVPGLKKQDMQSSFYGLLASRYKLPIEGEDHQIHARNLTKDESRQLKAPAGAAALVVDGRGYTHGHRPVWYQVLVYRGDRYVLENSVRVGERANDSLLRLKAPNTNRPR
jgi:GntR family transcriptional regulator